MSVCGWVNAEQLKWSEWLNRLDKCSTNAVILLFPFLARKQTVWHFKKKGDAFTVASILIFFFQEKRLSSLSLTMLRGCCSGSIHSNCLMEIQLFGPSFFVFQVFSSFLSWSLDQRHPSHTVTTLLKAQDSGYPLCDRSRTVSVLLF